MNSHFLSLLQWLIALTCSTWEHFHPWKTLCHLPQGSSIAGKTVFSWTPVNILAIYTGLIHEWRLSEPTAVVNLLSDSTWTSFHPWKMLYHRLQGSSTSGKPVLPWRQVNILAVYTESNHEQTLSESTTVIQWRYLTPTGYVSTYGRRSTALSQITRLLNSWKDCSAMKASQYSGHLYWIKPRIHTFWACCSGY